MRFLSFRLPKMRNPRVLLLAVVVFPVLLFISKVVIIDKLINNILTSLQAVPTERGPPSQTRQTPTNQSYVYLWPPCERNVSAASITGFSSFPGFMQDFLYYQHCRHFPMLLDLPDKCGGAEKSGDVFLLLVIKSSPLNFDRREVLRKTWAQERLQNGVWVRRIFISGTTGSGFEKERMNKLLELEQREHHDILQWDFKDTFQNLTLKQVLFLEWMERNCPEVRFLMNGDDDVFANTDNMVEYLQSLQDNDGSKHLFIGYYVEGMPPVRDGGRYLVPVQLYKPDTYPPYCSGGGFLLSGYTALVIYNMSLSIDLLPIDDAYMGLCMKKAGLRPSHHQSIYPWGIRVPKTVDLYDPCFYKDVLLVHRYLSDKLYFLWHKIHDPNLKCGKTFLKMQN